MSKQVKGLILSRLVILISIILVPIIIFLIFILVDFRLWFSNDPILTFWVIKALCPLVFSVSWLFFMILFANRFSTTIESISTTSGVIPLRLRFFFGVNAIIILLIFVFPLITPLISVLTFMAIAWRLTTFRKDSWDDDSKTPFFTKFMMAFFSIVPIFCAVCVLPEIIVLSLFLWNDIWVPLLDYIFIISLCLCTALAIGSLFILFSNSGISEFEQIFTSSDEKKSYTNIRILEIVLFIFFLFLALYPFELINLIYNLGFFIILFVTVINFLRGKQKTRKFRGHLLGYILAAVFMGSNLIIFNIELSNLMKIWTLIISAILFISVFFYTFITLEDEPEGY